MAEGEHAIRIRAINCQGNTSAPLSGTFTVDTIPPSSGSVLVDSGAAYATSQNITLTLAAADDGTGVGQMMIANSSDFADATWRDYVTSTAWTLAAGDGPKTVHVKFRDRAGNVSAVYSDSIVLDTAPPAGSVAIDDGAPYARQAAVTLSLPAQDAGSGLGDLRFSNDGTHWSAWEVYAPSREWTLAGPDGDKSVYVQFRDRAGNVRTGSDTIVLDRAPPASAVLPLAAQSALSFTVRWSGSDATSGVAAYDVQVRDGAAGSWTAWLSGTTSTSVPFTGEAGHTYYFRSRAADRAGNLEAWPSDPNGDTFTRLLRRIFLPIVSKG